MFESSKPAPVTNLRQLPPVAHVAIFFTIGIWLGDTAPLPLTHTVTMTGVWSLSATVLRHGNSPRLSSVCICAVCVSFGMVRTGVQTMNSGNMTLKELCRDQATEVTVKGQISSIPIVHRKPESLYSPRLYGPPQQTRFTLDIHTILVDGQQSETSGTCQVYAQGQIADLYSCGDNVSVSGRLDWPLPPGNPGEFDFAHFLKRQQISGMLFVDHFSNIEIEHATHPMAPMRLLGSIRAEAYRILAVNVAPDVRPIAMALLLGSRHELPPEIRQAFVASGTMHLLAISGLHVGILCLFLLRIQHMLLVQHRYALLLTLFICICYAFMTDLRPSVLRATMFFLVFVVGEFVRRNQTMPGLLAVTALLLMLFRPYIVFEIGAWLSFLSVAALGWEASHRSSRSQQNDAPPDALTPGDQLRQSSLNLWRWLTVRYRQMLYILLFTTPLIASTFHVVSPIGLAVNIALIPLTALALCTGFLTLAPGLLHPATAAAPGWIFSGLLKGLVAAVTTTASIDTGHFYVADFPAWFLLTYYSLLVVALLLRQQIWQRITVGLLVIVWLVVLGQPQEISSTSTLTCTVLDVGQGNATVVECPDGKVFLVDAGARNRGDRTADTVCRFLWNRGHRRLSGIIISHPDPDHFNGLPGILARIPVSEVAISTDFHTSDNNTAKALINLITKHRIPLRTVTSGHILKAGNTTLEIHQAQQTDDKNFDANERSLVVNLRHHNTGILLAGDIERRGATQLLSQIGRTNVLVAPGHGSKTANTSATAESAAPDYVIVSAASDSNRMYLDDVYSASNPVLFTSRSGAITLRAEGHKPVQITSYRSAGRENSYRQ